MNDKLSEKLLTELDGTLIYIPKFFDQSFFEELEREIEFEEGEISLFGKVVKVPRLQALYGDPGVSYKYSGKTIFAKKWVGPLITIKKRIEQYLEIERFNSVLCNLYRDGQDSNGEHRDNERELGKVPLIASASFGESRKFVIKHMSTGAKDSVLLEDRSLLVMRPPFQTYWKHSLPKSKKVTKPRINLTFRQIYN